MMNHKLAIQVLTLLASIVLISACGGGTASAQNQPSGTPTAVIPGAAPAPVADELINGIKVPPDPGADKDLTVAGVDTDGNGIRDEIDRWIATKFGNKPNILADIQKTAKGYQSLLVTSPVTREKALSAFYITLDNGICVGRKFAQLGINRSQITGEVWLRTYNTKERMDARKNVATAAGMIVRSVDETTCS
jgi:hypothetical protein